MSHLWVTVMCLTILALFQGAAMRPSGRHGGVTPTAQEAGSPPRASKDSLGCIAMRLLRTRTRYDQPGSADAL